MVEEEKVNLAIQVLLNCSMECDGDPTLASSILKKDLVEEGISVQVCEELATFVPLAFSREIYKEMQGPDYYVVAYMSSRKERQMKLFHNSLFQCACVIASEWKSDDEKKIIASFSGEYQAITNLIEGSKELGIEIETVGVSPPYVVYSGQPADPWWKFW